MKDFKVIKQLSEIWKINLPEKSFKTIEERQEKINEVLSKTNIDLDFCQLKEEESISGLIWKFYKVSYKIEEIKPDEMLLPKDNQTVVKSITKIVKEDKDSFDPNLYFILIKSDPRKTDESIAILMYHNYSNEEDEYYDYLSSHDKEYIESIYRAYKEIGIKPMVMYKEYNNSRFILETDESEDKTFYEKLIKHFSHNQYITGSKEDIRENIK